MAGARWHRKVMFFLAKILLIQPLKSKMFLPTHGQKLFWKGYHSIATHVVYPFCHMSLITARAIFCSAMFHVVCTCTFFGDTIFACWRDKSENDHDSDSKCQTTYLFHWCEFQRFSSVKTKNIRCMFVSRVLFLFVNFQLVTRNETKQQIRNHI
jgi:hypothetical protein